MPPALEIVDTPADAAEQELAPLIVREPLAAYLDERGLGSGPVEAEIDPDELVRDAAASCPSEAISLIDADTGQPVDLD